MEVCIYFCKGFFVRQLCIWNYNSRNIFVKFFVYSVVIRVQSILIFSISMIDVNKIILYNYTIIKFYSAIRRPHLLIREKGERLCLRGF